MNRLGASARSMILTLEFSSLPMATGSFMEPPSLPASRNWTRSSIAAEVGSMKWDRSSLGLILGSTAGGSGSASCFTVSSGFSMTGSSLIGSSVRGSSTTGVSETTGSGSETSTGDSWTGEATGSGTGVSSVFWSSGFTCLESDFDGASFLLAFPRKKATTIPTERRSTRTVVSMVTAN